MKSFSTKIHLMLLSASLLCLAGCQSSTSPSATVSTSADGPLPLEEISILTSNDSNLVKAAQWAHEKALSYSHDGSGDEVGPWFEAALPSREAFCMRDAAHQATGAHVIGLQAQNYNMMYRFAENISEEKDWCSYWEINRYNKPAPVDYHSDKDFWYNLDANLDVTQACFKLYQWTGDERYLNDKTFAHFYKATMENYVPHWELDIDHLMDRTDYMHGPAANEPPTAYGGCRGLASYAESFPGIAVSVDLIGSLYAGHHAYSRMLALQGNDADAASYEQRALAYRQLLDERWWDEGKNHYHTFWTSAGEFHRGEGVPMLLWFNTTDRPERIRASVDDILSKEWNVENLSYFPMLLYRLGYDKEAYSNLMSLSSNPRRGYPEASYGWMEGLVGGYMGIEPDAATSTVSTLMHGAVADTTTLRNVPLWDGYITVEHQGQKTSCLCNGTSRTITWEARFQGTHTKAKAGRRTVPCQPNKDILGNEYSTATIAVAPGESILVRCKD